MRRVVVVKKLMSVIVGSLVLLGLTQIVAAATLEEEVAPRIKKVGSVCVEGEDCAAATATATVATADTGAGGKSTYEKTCATCHAAGIAGAPRFGNSADWGPRIDQGMDALYGSAVNGKPPGMPAKGMCFTCTDDDLKAAVDYMVNAAK